MLRLTSAGTPRAAPRLRPGASRSAVPVPPQVPSGRARAASRRPRLPAGLEGALRCRVLSSQSDGGRGAGSLGVSTGWLRFLRNGRCASWWLRKRRPSEASESRSDSAPGRPRTLSGLSISSGRAGPGWTRTLAAESCAEPRGEVVWGGQ